VRTCLATIFTESGGKGPEGYAEGDAESAHKAGLRQMRVYEDWIAKGLAHRAAFAGGSEGGGLAIGILVECADPIRAPDELAWWVEKGVCAIGLTWGNGSRYAGGNSKGEGLTDLGREMVRAMDELGVVHDLSHLSQRATEELLELTNGRVIASHSNCRALLSGESNPWWQRHISDEVIQEVGRRGGVIGLNLCASFIRHDLDKSKGERPTIARTIDHVGRVCELMGRRTGVGLGSDLDGGFSADWLPEGIRTPSDLTLLTDELKRRGWSDDECAGFAHGNWDRFWGIP
ncbi:MAG: dipeptidase, partial [Phycisphaerales bacterium]|nr:dipeptidase [Phycisphaerales bacterium]